MEVTRTGNTSKRYTICVPNSGDPPRAIVFVFGWAFSRMKDVQKYSELYENRGCATIMGILDPRSVAVKNDTAIADFVNGAMEEATVLLSMLEGKNNSRERIPIIVHAFCNGGGFCRLGLHEALATKREDKEQDDQKVMIKENNEALATTREDEDQDDPKVMLRERLAAEVFDSAPIYISTKSSLAALAGVVKNPFIFWLLVIAGTVANYMKYFWSLLTTGEAFYVTYWNKMKEADACPHQFFVYSEADPVCDHKRVDEFVEYRRSKGKGSVKVMKFTDTGHCRHMQSHQKEYCDIVDEAILSAIVEMRKREDDQKRSRL